MNAPARLSLYGLGLVAAFGAAYLLSGAVVPDSVVEDRIAAVEDDHGTHEEPAEAETGAAALPGLALESEGYLLSPISAPSAVDEDGELGFSVLDANGEPVLEYTEEHEKELHLIIVREDGSQFRHVHPELDGDGTWSLPWSWAEAGTYRVFADFTPADGDSGITLTRSISVAGDLAPVALGDDVRSASAGNFEVRLSGDLAVGDSSILSLEVLRDGKPVTTMQPYLGAFGHLVALRDGDLAYLHVHPEGNEPEAGQLSGPTVEFASEAPTPGRYLLYFDFQVGDEVHTASFVVTADAGAAQEAPADDASEDAPATEDAPADDGHSEH